MHAWHYTVGDSYILIALDKQIRPSTLHVPRGERPIVWFSAHPLWEPTATKGIVDGFGNKRDATMDEMHRNGHGLFRLGVDVNTLIPYRRLIAVARISAKMARALEKTALEAGADPNDWYGSTDAVSIMGAQAQKLVAGNWIDT